MKIQRRPWLIAVVLGACSANPVEVYGVPSSSLIVRVGQELLVTMRTVGPGEYTSPPELAGSAVAFVGMSLASEQVPAGATQVFRFKGVALGQTIVRFHNTDPLHADVRDTIIVR